jgi:hypothetical protein
MKIISAWREYAALACGGVLVPAFCKVAAYEVLLA